MTKDPHLIFLLLGLFFVPLERAFAIMRHQSIVRKGLVTDFIYFLSNKYLNQFGQLVLVSIIVPTYHYLAKTNSVTAVENSVPFWIELTEVIILADFLVYWAHRLTHHIPFLWKFHAIHHSNTELDWLAAFRLHFLDQIFTKAISMVPIFLMGFSKETIEINIIFITVHAAFNHSNVRISLPILRYIICTPEFHRWHHSTDPKYAYKHFAGSFAIWDYLFGSGMRMDGSFPKEIGLSNPIPDSFLEQLKYPFQQWLLPLQTNLRNKRSMAWNTRLTKV